VDTDGTAARAGAARPGSAAATPVQKAAPSPGQKAAPSPGVTVPPVAARPTTVDPRTGSGVPAQAPASSVAAPAQAQAVSASRPVGPRRARLLVTRLDPWSVMKTAFMLSVSIGIVLLMSTALLWWTLDVTGVFAAIGRTVDDVAGSGSSSFDFLSFVGFSRIMGIALVLTAIEIVLGSALATLFAFLYNLSVGLTGGLEVTLSEDA
jgi:hypothetical protein